MLTRLTQFAGLLGSSVSLAALGTLTSALCAQAQAQAQAQSRAPAADSAQLTVTEAAVPPAEPRQVDLALLLRFADEHAPALLQAAQRREYGAAAREAAAPLLAKNPTLELGVGPRFDRAGESGVDFLVNLEQALEIGGQRGLRGRAAQRLQARIDSDVLLARRELRRQVSLGYYAAAIAGEQVRLAERVVAFAADLLRVAQRRLAQGESSIIDLRLAESDAAQAEQARIVAALALRQAQLTLCELTGWPLESPPQLRAGLEPLDAVPSLAQTLAAAGPHHPELRARRAHVVEAHARAELASREAWPNPALGVSVAREGHRVSGEGPNYIVLGTLGLSLPLWQQNQLERARARADENAALADESATRIQLRARLASAHAQLMAADERVRLFATRIVPTLEENLSHLQRGFEAGEISLVNVTVARERFLQVQRDALGSYADYYRSRVELEYLTGSAGVPAKASAEAAP